MMTITTSYNNSTSTVVLTKAARRSDGQVLLTVPSDVQANGKLSIQFSEPCFATVNTLTASKSKVVTVCSCKLDKLMSVSFVYGGRTYCVTLKGSNVVVKCVATMRSVVAEASEGLELAAQTLSAEKLAKLNERLNTGAAKALLMSHIAMAKAIADGSVGSSWRAPRLSVLSFVDEQKLAKKPFDTIEMVDYKGDDADLVANRYQIGLLAYNLKRRGIVDLTSTMEQADSKGALKEGSYWPMVSMSFGELIKLAKNRKAKYAKKAKAKGKTVLYNPTKALNMGTNVGQLWKNITDGKVRFNWNGVNYRFCFQGAGDGKVAKARYWMVDCDLYEQVMDTIRCGMDFAEVQKQKGFIKPGYYQALTVTGLDVLVEPELLAELWAHTQVLADNEITLEREVMVVVDHENQHLETKKLKENIADGAMFAVQKAMAILHKAGLAVDEHLCQARGDGFIKGMVFEIPEDALPTGTGVNFWNEEFDWADVWFVITESAFKAACGYKNREDWLSNEPSFGFKHPSHRARLFNGQVADTLCLTEDEMRSLRANSVRAFQDVILCNDVLNTSALAGAFKNAALAGFAPENFESLTTEELVKSFQEYHQRWEGARIRELNTYHWNVGGFNQYLMPDYRAYFGTGVSLHKKGDKLEDGTTCLYDEVCAPQLPEGLLVLARNPIACADELVVVRNVHVAGGVYGALMLPSGSRLMNILSGADFDGDQILATANEALVGIVLAKECGQEFWFEKPKAHYEAWAEAALAEMQNTLFQGSAQNASRILNCDLDYESKRWLSRFFSAMMQVAVDAGKYGYDLPAKWLSFSKTFANQGYKLPGWKWSKGEGREAGNRALLQIQDSLMEQGHDPAEDTFMEKVYAKLLKQYDVTVYDAGVVQANDEVVKTVVDGQRVSIQARKFQAKDLAALLPEMRDVYELYFEEYARTYENDED